MVPFLLKSNQRFIDGDELKQDLKKISDAWEILSREEQIRVRSERGNAPPEDESSLTFKLWKELRGKISAPLPKEILQIKLVDSSLPEDQQVEFTLEELIRSKMKELDRSAPLSTGDVDSLRKVHQDDPSTYGVRETKISRQRIKKMYPELTDEDLDKAASNG